MLIELTIEEFALIEEVRLAFEAGLNVLTGETGAGKSIIIDAVQALLGARVSPDMVRTGADRATLEGVFDLKHWPEQQGQLRDLGFEVGDDELLVIRREIAKNGRTVVRLNGQTATLAMVRQATAGLVDIHGQHEHQNLLSPEKHLELLDQYGGSLVAEEKRVQLLDSYGGGLLLSLREQVEEGHQALGEIRRELAALLGDDRDRARREDLLHFQLKELVDAELKPDEEEALEAEARVLASAEKLKRLAEGAYQALYEGQRHQLAANDLIGQAQANLADAAAIDPGLSPLLEMLDAATAQVTEVSRFLSSYREEVEHDPARLAAIDQRLALLTNLKRKYGDSVAEMLAYQEQVAAELDRLAQSEELIGALKQQEAELGEALVDLAKKLSEARLAAAQELGRRIEGELRDLGMSAARFTVEVSQPEGADWHQIGPKGWDAVEFLFSPNAGEPLKPLARIASGGELSRIMLSLKAILARVDQVPSLIFDEVDTGIGGRAAQAVAEKLATISKDRQVLAVTHLAQVAAMADHQYLIAKEETATQRTITRVSRLSPEGRAEELARMIGGSEVTPLTLENARELLSRAAAHKERR